MNVETQDDSLVIDGVIITKKMVDALRGMQENKNDEANYYRTKLFEIGYKIFITNIDFEKKITDDELRDLYYLCEFLENIKKPVE